MAHNYYRQGLEGGWKLNKLLRKSEHDYICGACGKTFHRRGQNMKGVNYCSLRCKYTKQKELPNPQNKHVKAMILLAQKPPVEGEIRSALGAGLSPSGGTRQWLICSMCHKGRWARVRKQRIISSICKLCFTNIQRQKVGDKNPLWKGGRSINHMGYVEVRLYPNNPYYTMINKTGTVLEHRLVVAQSLGRCLKPEEIVHHLNHNKTDNRLENLQLHTIPRHAQITILENRLTYLENRVLLLESENTLLREQLMRLNNEPKSSYSI